MNGAEMRERMQRGEVMKGLGVRLARTTEIAAVAKACGFDWLFLDLEHNPMSPDLACEMAIAAQSAGLAPLARIPGHEPTIASRLLDGGVGGIIVPHVDHADEVRPVVERCKFAPVGRRSIGGQLPQLGYQVLPAEQHMRLVNERTLICAMIESPMAVDNAADIAAVEGVDLLLFGSNDLCIEMGIPGDLANKRVEEAYRHVIEVANKAGKFVGLGGVYSPDLLQRYLPLGFRFALLGADMSMLIASAREKTAYVTKLLAS